MAENLRQRINRSKLEDRPFCRQPRVIMESVKKVTLQLRLGRLFSQEIAITAVAASRQLMCSWDLHL